MFETFVGEGKPNSEEIVGLVAYALYKKAKIEYVRKIRRANNRAPSADELRIHYESFTSQQVEASRLVAESALLNFAESFVEDARPGIIKEALSGKFWPDIEGDVRKLSLHPDPHRCDSSSAVERCGHVESARKSQPAKSRSARCQPGAARRSDA